MPAVAVEASRFTFQSPSLLTSDLVLLGVLGSGGYSIVYRGIYQGADVAVKFTASTHLDKAGLREALVAPQLNHPHVIKTYCTRGAMLTREFLEQLYGGPPPAMPPGAGPTCMLNYSLSENSNDGFGDPRRGLPARTTPDSVLVQPASVHALASTPHAWPPAQGAEDQDGSSTLTIGDQHSLAPLPLPPSPPPPPPRAQSTPCVPPGGAAAAAVAIGQMAGPLGSGPEAREHDGRLPARGYGYDEPRLWDGWRDVLVRVGATSCNNCVVVSVQELAECGSLERAIRAGLFRHKPGDEQATQLARRALLRTASEVCRGMIHMHSAQVVHGDIKPANVLLVRSRADRRGFTAKVADFGLAHVLGLANSRMDTSSWGTVCYAPPEMMEGTVSKACDVYSFGMVLYEMLAGQPPYTELSVAQIMMGLTMHSLRPPWPEALWPELCAVGQRCLAADPGARPSFRQLEEELVGLEMAVRNVSKGLKLRAMTADGSSSLNLTPHAGSSRSPSGLHFGAASPIAHGWPPAPRATHPLPTDPAAHERPLPASTPPPPDESAVTTDWTEG